MKELLIVLLALNIGVVSAKDKKVSKEEREKLKQEIRKEIEEENKKKKKNKKKNANTYQLTKKDRTALEYGDMSQVQYVVGGVIGSVYGLGIGQAIQGRYTDTGWMFTVSDAVGYTMFLQGLGDCIIDEDNCSRLSNGLLVLYVSRIWGIFDVWGRGYKLKSRNERLQDMKKDGKWSFYVLPATDSPGTMGMLSYRF